MCVSGEHRGLGPSISKVRSLKMDRKVWTEELIQVFLFFFFFAYFLFSVLSTTVQHMHFLPAQFRFKQHL